MRRAWILVLGLVASLVVAAPLIGATASPPGPQLVSLDGGATGFYNYDFTSRTLGVPDNQDWPVTIIFRGDVSVLGIKLALLGSFPWPGSIENGRVSQGPLASWDPDPGQKSRLCSLTAPAVHYRLYAPPLLGRFLSPTQGAYVVASTHLDKGECGPYPVAGWSEDAAHAVAEAARARGWTVQENDPDPAYFLDNAEDPAHWDGPPTGPWLGNHFWQSDGKPTIIDVP